MEKMMGNGYKSSFLVGKVKQVGTCKQKLTTLFAEENNQKKLEIRCLKN